MLTKVLRMCLQRHIRAVQLHRSLNHLHTRRISSDNCQRRSISSEISFVDLETKAVSVKDSLYPLSDDLTIQRLKSCESYYEALNFVDNVGTFDKEKVCQLILVLYDHFKFLENEPLPNLEPVVARFNHFIDDLTMDEATVCFQYLSILGVNFKHPTMELITNRMMKEVVNDEDCRLEHLSRFTSVFTRDKGLYSSSLAIATLPLVTKRLQNCSNFNDFMLITTCLIHICSVLSLDHLETFKKKVEEFLKHNLIGTQTTAQELLRIVYFLNYPHWSFCNTGLIRRLLIELESHIPTLDKRDLVAVNHIFNSHLETAKIVPGLVRRAQELLEESPDVELLAVAAHNVTPDQRTKTASMVSSFLSTYQISSTQSGETLQTVFKILRLLKISDLDLCDTFWTKALNEIYGTSVPNLNFRLTRHILKYMLFNSNLGGTYRHKEFESSVIEMLLVEIKKTLAPKEFVVFASFIIAYHGNNSISLPQFIVTKIEELHEQFSIKDCVQLSRGIQIRNESKHKHFYSPALRIQIDSIGFTLAKCAERHLQSDNIHLQDLNTIFKAFNNRKAARHSSLFYEVINRYEGKKHELNSKLIRDIAYNLNVSNFRMDSLCNQFLDYIIDNYEHVTGDTVEKILSCCYNFSYFPEKLEVFDRSSEIIVRDFNYMSGLSIVQALLALIFFKACPQQLIAMVFSNEFIKRLEQEIAMCYSKVTYSRHVMNQLMKLNRAVCLDCPEVNIKWFQRSLMASAVPRYRSNLFLDLQATLLSIVKSPDNLVTDRITPYDYRIDFEVNLDQYNRFVAPQSDTNDETYNHELMPNVSKIAILLVGNRMVCDNDLSRIKGFELLRMRHLEMLGYRVIHVNMNEFRSLYRSYTSKIKYMKELLQLAA